jgi:hypothetical protein
MDYLSIGASLLSAGGGLFGGGSKAPERAARDAAARAQYAQEEAQAQAQAQLSPFVSDGTNAERDLAYLTGTGGYNVSRPTYEQAYEELRDEHFKKYGKDYNRNSNVPGQRAEATRRYESRLADWQKGFDEWKTQQGSNPRFGSLNRSFTEDDLNNDVVYNKGLQFGLDNGNNAIEARARASGSSDSGSVLKELARFGNDYGTTKAGDAQGRFMNDKTFTYNALSNQAQRGLGAIGTGIGVSTGAASNIGNSNQNLSNNLLASSQARSDNQQNAFQGLLGNLLYSARSSRNAGVSAGGYDPNTSGQVYPNWNYGRP